MTQTFDNALHGLDAVNASVQDRELVELLARHGREEGAILDRYQRFAEQADSPAARYLVGLIIEDEHRHHRILAELANAIAWGWTGLSPEPAVPELDPHRHSDGILQAETRELLAAEHADAKHLNELRRRLHPYAKTTLWELLVDMLQLDTRKHIRMLEFIEHQAR